ncbi:MAG: hypothetical protein JWR50_1659, partial [Mucilaginibacter sp.]|nr:hypothetical protein [Mucilaginibacter sp.]
MKQLFLTLILAALIAVGCGHATKTDSTGSDSVNQELKKMALSAPVGIVYKTLNGVDENVAKDWIKNYQTAITPPTSVKLKIVSYFLNKNMV